MEQESQNSPIPTAVLTYVQYVSDVMAASDLLVTKAGGLTTFEAIARRLPMAIDMITEPMPQEIGTAEMLIETGLASPITEPDQLVKLVANMKSLPNRELKPLPSRHNLDHVDAVYDIASIILKCCAEGRLKQVIPSVEAYPAEKGLIS